MVENYDPAVAVAHGAEVLDEIKPGWFEAVDLHTLTFTSPKHCIFGQVFGDLFDGYHALRLHGHETDGGYDVGVNIPNTWRAAGHSWHDTILKPHWRAEVEKRRSARS